MNLYDKHIHDKINFQKIKYNYTMWSIELLCLKFHIKQLYIMCKL